MENQKTDYNKIIGSNIRFERQKLELTIEELSEILNIAPGFLGLIERGQRGTSIRNLCRIADFFSITLDDLVRKDLSFASENGDKVSEPITEQKSKHLTAVSLIHNLDVDELEFIINSIKGLKKLTKLKSIETLYEE